MAATLSDHQRELDRLSQSAMAFHPDDEHASATASSMAELLRSLQQLAVELDPAERRALRTDRRDASGPTGDEVAQIRERLLSTEAFSVLDEPPFSPN